MLDKYRRLWNRHVMHGFDVPDSLQSITCIDSEREVEPQVAGLQQQDVDALWQSVENFYRSAMHPMVGICLRRHGEIVLNRTIGYVSGIGGRSDDDGHEPIVADIDTPVCLFSASKAVTAVLAHKAAEEGFFNLLNPVSHYLPEFAANGKGNITIHQLLGHRAGVPRLDPDVPMETLFDHDAVLKLVCAAKPIDRDGRVTAYHAITSGFVLAELIRVTTGKSLQQYLDQTIRKPMGMQNFRYGLLPEQLQLAPRHYVTGLPLGPLIGGVLKQVLGVDADVAIEFKTAVIPSANLYSTAEETSRFFQMLLDNGEYVDPVSQKRHQILQPLTVLGATRETSKMQIDKALFLPMRYSAGMMLGSDPVGIYGLNTNHAYGHIGFSNVFCWADPQRDISIALLTSGKPVVGSHMMTLLKMMHSISSVCGPCVDMERDEPGYKKRRAVV